MMLYVAFALSIVATVLHFIAPRTKTTLDDKAADALDKVIVLLPKPVTAPKA